MSIQRSGELCDVVRHVTGGELHEGAMPGGIDALPVMRRDGSTVVVVRQGATDDEVRPAVERVLAAFWPSK